MLSWNLSSNLRNTAAFAAIAISATIVLMANDANAGFKGSIAFTEEEKNAHLTALPAILQTAADCLEQDMQRHYDFYTQYGISPFYGDRGAFSKMTPADRRQHLIRLGKNPALLSELQPTSTLTDKFLAGLTETSSPVGI